MFFCKLSLGAGEFWWARFPKQRGFILYARPRGFIHPAQAPPIKESTSCADSQFFATAALITRTYPESLPRQYASTGGAPLLNRHLWISYPRTFCS